MISCPICAPGWAGRALIEMETSYVAGGGGPSVLPGYTVVVAKRHVREPFALAADELTTWWAECMLVTTPEQVDALTSAVVRLRGSV